MHNYAMAPRIQHKSRIATDIILYATTTATTREHRKPERSKQSCTFEDNEERQRKYSQEHDNINMFLFSRAPDRITVCIAADGPRTRSESSLRAVTPDHCGVEAGRPADDPRHSVARLPIMSP